MNNNTHENQSLQFYMQEIAAAPLTAEEEKALAIKARQGSSRALDKLITASLPLVVSTARRYQRSRLPLADLINEGNLALVRAARRYDPTRQASFSSYAVWHVRHAMEHAIAQQQHTVSLPQREQAQQAQIARIDAEFRKHHQRQPDICEIASAAGISEHNVKHAMTGAIQQTAIDTPLSPHSPVTLLDRMPDTAAAPADQMLISSIAGSRLSCAISQLPQREQNVLRDFYGIGRHHLTLAEIGQQYGFSRERARQIRKKALRHLRRAVRTTGVALCK